RVDLHGHHAPGGVEQRQGQRTQTRAHLHHGVLAADTGRADDPPDRVGVVDGVLPERLGGAAPQLVGEAAHLLRSERRSKPAEGRVRTRQRRPSLEVQAGQAPQPCPAWTFSATAICSSREARCAAGAYSVPPKAAQVLGVNWRPPEKPLPLLMLQLPVDSHCAIASQTPPREDSGADGAGLVPTRTSAGRGSVRTSSSRRSRSVSCPLTRVTE